MAIRGSIKCQAKKVGKKVNKIAGFVEKKSGDEFGKMVNFRKFEFLMKSFRKRSLLGGN